MANDIIYKKMKMFNLIIFNLSLTSFNNWQIFFYIFLKIRKHNRE